MTRPKDPTSPLGRIYSVAEAAKALGIGRPKLEALIGEFPYYTPNGNRKLFNDDDIKKLWEVRRVKIPTTTVLDGYATGGSGHWFPLVPDADPFADLLRRKTKRKP